MTILNIKKMFLLFAILNNTHQSKNATEQEQKDSEIYQLKGICTKRWDLSKGLIYSEP